MRLDRGDAQQQEEGEEKKRRSRCSEFQTTIPGQKLGGARHPCRCVFGSREVAVIQPGRGRGMSLLPLFLFSDASL